MVKRSKENLRSDFWNEAASPGEQEVYHTPIPPQQRILLSFENDSLFLRKFPAQSNEADYLLRIDVTLDCIPLCQPLDTNSLLLKIKINLAPRAV